MEYAGQPSSYYSPLNLSIAVGTIPETSAAVPGVPVTLEQIIALSAQMVIRTDAVEDAWKAFCKGPQDKDVPVTGDDSPAPEDRLERAGWFLDRALRRLTDLAADIRSRT